MRVISMSALCAGLVLAVAGGCSKDQDARSPADERAAVEGDEDDSVWEKGWNAIAEGAEETGEAGKWVFEKTKDGAIMVAEKTREVSGESGEEVGDAAVLSAVKARLADDDRVSADDIDVDVEDGTVELRGKVDSSAEASAAVRTTLGTRGVEEVHSFLTW